jgi:transposase
MPITLDSEVKAELELRHRTERDSRVADRIKVLLLSSEGWGKQAISQALRLHQDTVSEHLREWLKDGKLQPKNGGSDSHLNAADTELILAHLKETLYTTVNEIRDYVVKHFDVAYTNSGLTKWLHAHGFSYKKPVLQPAKANPVLQTEFIEQYTELRDSAWLSGEPIIFIDAVHPTMVTKTGYGWIKKGVSKIIAQTASRTRINIIGGIELSSLNVVNTQVETVNAETTLAFLDRLKAAYPLAKTIHVILDQSGYHRSIAVREGAAARGIKLHFLPPYSPNLNPIERLWKLMNEMCRNNVVFESFKAFNAAIQDFFEKIPIIKDRLAQRITDNFQTFSTASSS